MKRMNMLSLFAVALSISGIVSIVKHRPVERTPQIPKLICKFSLKSSAARTRH